MSISRPLLLLACIWSAVGCEAQPVAQTPIASEQAPLLGAVRYGADCNASDKQFLAKAMKYGRTAAASAAFLQCVDSASRTGMTTLGGATYGPYLKCTNDPFFSSDLTYQIARAQDAMRSSVDVAIGCTGGAGNASASVDQYAHLTPEAFSFSGWLRSVSGSLAWPVCNGSNGPNCRFAGEPWPWSQTADIMWHEASHQQGYIHGVGTPAQAAAGCGYAGYSDAQYNFQRNSMPYILGGCLGEVIARSGVRCGAPLENGSGLNLITSFTGTTCAVARDPFDATVSWQFAGTPSTASKIAACPSGRIYALNTNGSLNVNNSGGADGAWTYVTSLPYTQQITCANDRIYAFNTDRTLWRNDGTDTSVSWTYVGQPSGAARIAGTTINYFLANYPVFYALNDDHSLWRSDTGQNGTWTYLGSAGSADRLAAGGNFLDARPFALNYDKTLWLNAGDGCNDYWHQIDTPFSAVEISAGNHTTVYALNSDHTLWRGTVNGSTFLIPTAFGAQRHCNGTSLVP